MSDDPQTRFQWLNDMLSIPRNIMWGVEQKFEDALLGCSTNHIPDLRGKVAMVTGGNSGIGYETCKKLAMNRAKVYLLARNIERGEEAAARIRHEVGLRCGQIVPLACDLSSLANVQRLVAEFTTSGDPLHILVANAGVCHPGPYARTEDGFEQTLAIDYYSQVWLIMSLLDLLVASAPSRIVLQSSVGEAVGSLDWENLKGDKFKDSGLRPYGCAKLWMLMFADELQRRLRAMGGRAQEVDVFGVHPGGSDTPGLNQKVDVVTYWTGWMLRLGGLFIGHPPWRAAMPALYAATEPYLEGRGFDIFGPNELNLLMLSRYHPRNILWYTGGKAARSRLFDETLRVLAEAGKPVLRTLPPVKYEAGSAAGVVSKAADAAENTGKKAADAAESTGHKAADAADNTGKKAADVAEHTGSKAAGAAQYTGSKVADAADSTGNAGKKAADAADSTGKKAADAADSTGKKVADAADSTGKKTSNAINVKAHAARQQVS